MPAIVADSDFALSERDDDLYEVVGGVRVEMSAMSAFETVLASILVSMLNEFARPRRLGVAVTETLFLIDPSRDLRRRPDVAFVDYRRWSTKRIARENAWNVIPNLAIEIVSPTNLAEEIEKKVFEYLARGVELVWVIFPETERVHVYRTPERSTIVDATGHLDGETVLPGFRVGIAELFEALNRPDLADQQP